MKPRKNNNTNLDKSDDFANQIEEVVTCFLCGKPMSETQKARLVSEFTAVVNDQVRRRLDAISLN